MVDKTQGIRGQQGIIHIAQNHGLSMRELNEADSLITDIVN
jgi:hypothetical protein